MSEKEEGSVRNDESQHHEGSDNGLGMLVKSEGRISGHVGTSNKSSGSFRNALVLGRIDEDALLSEGNDSERRREMEKRARKKLEFNEETKEQQQRATPDQNQQNPLEPIIGASQKSFGSDINQMNERDSTEYEIDDLNFNLGTMTIEQDHDYDDETDQINNHKLKRTVMTILLTQRWRKTWKRATKRGKKGAKKVLYQPTYRLEPKQSIGPIKHLIIMKARNTFESLIDKHKNYDIEYTPRFLRIITEMIKNDAKSFKVTKSFKKRILFL